MAEFENREHREEPFSKAVRAGKRTYFFDVKTTRANDLYLTITESKKRFGEEGEKPYFEKHKIFLYKEDFEKFSDGLNEAVNFIKNNAPPIEPRPAADASPSTFSEGSRFSDVDYDDLGETKKDE
ncbi:MAG: DUF3276 family protein [Bacteroidia bacterium]